MSWFRRKPMEVPSPLWGVVADYDAKVVADWLEEESKKAESSETILMQTILALTLACAADFQRNVGEILRTGFPTANPDVIAFEGLAFSLFAVRQFHLPPGDYDEHDEPEMLVDAYREVIANLRCLIEKYTGWSIQKEWNARIIQHAQFPGIVEPMERLNGKLMSVAGVQVPPVLYGQPRLDALLSMELVTAVQAFTVIVPKATAKAIQNVISELNLLD